MLGLICTACELDSVHVTQGANVHTDACSLQVEVELHQTAGEWLQGPLPYQQSSTSNPLYLEDLLLQSDAYVGHHFPAGNGVQERFDDDYPYSAIQLYRECTHWTNAMHTTVHHLNAYYVQ